MCLAKTEKLVGRNNHYCFFHRFKCCGRETDVLWWYKAFLCLTYLEKRLELAEQACVMCLHTVAQYLNKVVCLSLNCFKFHPCIEIDLLHNLAK